jgi:hypothetical protein
MFIQDNQRKGYRVYREHSTDVAQEWKANQFGVTITDQNDQTGAYTTESLGDESGWVFWETASTTGAYRATGSWAQSWLVLVGAAGAIRPVYDGALTADTSFAIKTVIITTSTGDPTLVRAVDGVVPAVGTYGVVHQGSAHDNYALVFVPIGGGGASFLKARIKWYVDLEGDRSEGELVTYDPLTNLYTPTGTLIYIDYNKSRPCKFETAGDNTIFAVTLINPLHDRFGVERELYACVYCEQDLGHRITHLKRSAANATVLFGAIISEDKALPDKPWENISNGLVKTTLAGVPQNNVLLTRVPKEWDLTKGSWDWLELNDLSQGQPFYFRPIEPIMADPITNLWESETRQAENSLSTYGRK